MIGTLAREFPAARIEAMSLGMMLILWRRAGWARARDEQAAVRSAAIGARAAGQTNAGWREWMEQMRSAE